MNKTGIITWHNHGNFGGSLQSFALQHSLKKHFKIKADIIDWHSLWVPHSFLKKVKFILMRFLSIFIKRYYRPFLLFESKYLKLSKPIKSREALSKIGQSYSTIICGSDQIWAPNVFEPEYMIDFVSGKNVNKIAYAASIGLSSIPDELDNTYSELLLDFGSISVREKSGSDLLIKKYGVESSVVLDPSLLVDASDYRKIEKSFRMQKKKYIFCYFLGDEKRYIDTVLSFVNQQEYVVICFTKSKNEKNCVIHIDGIGPREFLWLVDNAECVFTDSYHGTIFSLLFHKDFYCFKRFNDGDAISQNSRIYQLDKWFNISDRILDVETDCCLKPSHINFDSFENKLKVAREQSLRFLKRALKC